MQRKLEYIKSKGYLNAKKQKTTEEYAEIVRRYAVVRKLALKALYVLDKNKKFELQGKIEIEITALIEKEIECLIRIAKNLNLTSSQKSLGYLMPENTMVKDIYTAQEFPFQKTFVFS